MFQISREVDYAIQLINRLSILKKDEKLSLRLFSTESNISFLFLQKIVRKLIKSGWVKSVRGPKGGYHLASSNVNISLKNIIESVDGPLAVSQCSGGTQICINAERCKTKKIWQNVHRSLQETLENTFLVKKKYELPN